MKKKKNWIAGAISKPGALHRQLGVKAGTKIPVKKLAMAAKKGGKEGKRARLAETLKSFHKTKKKMMNMPAGKAFGTPMAVPKAMQTSKNPSWVKQKSKSKTMCKKHSKKMCKSCAK